MKVRAFAQAAVVSLGVAGLLAACSSPTDANKANFAKAINTALAEHCIAVVPGGMLGPGPKYPISVPSDNSALGQFDALAKAGLLTATKGKVERQIHFGNAKKVPGTIYALTKAGKAALQSAKYKSFCVGTYTVDEVKDFTKPGNLGGVTFSKATFTYSPTDVAEWAKGEAVKAAFPGLAGKLKTKQEGHANLVLKNSGWSAKVPFL